MLLQTPSIQRFFSTFFKSYGSLYVAPFAEIFVYLIDVRSRTKTNLREVLVEAMRSLRKDKQYYLYLPSWFEDPKTHFGSPLGVLETLYPLINSEHTSNIIYRWGNYSKPGLVVKEDHQHVLQEKKIKKLRENRG